MNNITTIQTSIYAILAAYLGVEQSAITPLMLLDEQDAYSTVAFSIINTLENTFEINDAEFEVVETVGQVIDLVVRLRS